MRSFRALLISDIHMSNKLPQAVMVSDGATDRLFDQLSLWGRVHTAAKMHKANAMFVLGDLFDKSLVDAVTLTATVEAIMASPVPVYILPGNHDAVSTQGGRFNVEAFGKMGRKHVHYIGSASGNAPIQHEDWLRLWPMEYSTSAVALDRLDAIRASMDIHRFANEVLLLHHSILGCRHIGWTCDDGLEPDTVVEGFNAVYSGHFHEHQMFGSDGAGMYLGAPMHHRMDDEGRAAGFWIVTFRSDGSHTEAFVDGGAPQMHSAVWGGSAAKTRHAARPGDYLRVVIEATPADWIIKRPAVDEYIEKLKRDGIRATRKHRPIYHHGVRIALPTSGPGARVTMDQMSDAYVDSADVVTTGLDPVLLKQIGRQALDEARRRS